jgi:predicted enzyme related to lactoylglutathione lyase
VPSWVDLTTTDVERAKNFYANLFGWQWTANQMPPGGTYWMASLDGQSIAGLSAPPPGQSQSATPSMWNTYINVDNVDDTTARAQSAGAQVTVPPTTIGDSGRMAFIVDPAGAALGLWQAGTHTGAGLVNEPGSLIWNEVYAPDTAATVAFYSQVFGWQGEATPMDGGVSYTMFKLGDAMIGGTAPPMDQVAPRWQVWFGTADTQATAARAAELGATVLVPPTESQIGTFAFLVDPTGAPFSVITARQPS